MFVRTIATVACCAAALVAWQLPELSDAAARAPKHRNTYHGKTKQGRGIVFRLSRGRLELRRFSIELRCRDGSTLIDQESGFEPSTLAANGSFREYQYGSTDKVWFRGRVNGRALRGRVKVTDRWGHVRCHSGWVRFTAKRRG